MQPTFTALGGKCPPVCVGMTCRRLNIAGAMRQWRPRLEVNGEARQFVVAVPGESFEHVRGAEGTHASRNGQLAHLNGATPTRSTRPIRKLCLPRWPPACRRSPVWDHVLRRGESCFGWTQGRTGRSLDPEGCNKGSGDVLPIKIVATGGAEAFQC